jgi:hypothetical protein
VKYSDIDSDAYTVRQRIESGWAEWAARLTAMLVRKCRDRGLLAALLLAALVAGCGHLPGGGGPQPPSSPPPSEPPSSPPPPPPPPPPSGGEITDLRVSPEHPHCLVKNGKLWQIAAYGNLVTAIPERQRNGQSWKTDLQLLVDSKSDYARLWDKLWGDTDAIDLPHLWVPTAQKWDLSQKNPAYWSLIDEVVRAADAHGIVVEVMIWDRGLGGSQQDYKASPWHPANNVNGLGGELPDSGLGIPAFYTAGPGSKLGQLQALYVRWYADFAAAHKNVILEIENENRADDANNGRDWAHQWAQQIKARSPLTLTTFNSLNLETLEKVYALKPLDIVNVHFGKEGDDPLVLDRYVRTHWAKGKVIGVDEFANGLSNKGLLAEMCETITRDGAGFHIEDALTGADAVATARKMRELIAAQPKPFCAVGPTGPAPACPKETKRGWSILYVNRAGKRVCTGNTACEQAMRAGKLKPGDDFAIDSTALEGIQRPIPEGCGTCAENPTKWTFSGPGRTKVDGPCGFEVWPTKSGIVCAAPTRGGAEAVCKGITVK